MWRGFPVRESRFRRAGGLPVREAGRVPDHVERLSHGPLSRKPDGTADGTQHVSMPTHRMRPETERVPPPGSGDQLPACPAEGEAGVETAGAAVDGMPGKAGGWSGRRPYERVTASCMASAACRRSAGSRAETSSR